MKRHIYAKLERWAARFTARIVCVCPSEKRAALQWAITENEAKLCIIPNGVATKPETATSSPRAEKYRHLLQLDTTASIVCTIGRFVPQKGHAFIAEAIPSILKAYPDTWFIMVGEGPLCRRIRRQLEQNKVTDRCFILPEQEDVTGIYELATVVAIPSLWEGLPYVLLDAMGMGKPVVASNVGGMADVLTQHNGIRIAPGDATALADSITRLLGDAMLREQLSTNARATVREKYRLENMVQHVEQLYASVLYEIER